MKHVLAGVLVGSIFLSGCGAKEITDMKPMTLEEVAGNRLAKMSQDEKEGLVYQYVSDRIKVDKKRLLAVDDNEIEQANALFTDINSYLKGVKNDALKEEYINYLLMEFSRTPYEWKQSSVEAVGFDPAARLYFFDVTYETLPTYKTVIPQSKIPNGSPDEEALKKQRHSDFIAMMEMRANGSGNYALAAKEFQTRWGAVDEIRKEQQGIPLVARTAQASPKNIGKLTYAGLIQDSNFNSGATMTVRYVLSYKYNLGEETDLEVKSLYLKDYNVANGDQLLESLTDDDTSGVEVLKPFIDRLILSYQKAVDESNDAGLYSIFYDYSGVDKYYEDLSKYTYTSSGGYRFKVLSRTGTNVVVQVDRVNHVRAKGAEMSLPTYDETFVMNVILDTDDKIKIRSVNLVKSELVGEPLSVIKNVSGISDLIQYSGETFTADNKKKVEETLKDFGEVVFNAKVDTPDFTNVVDVGVSQETLRKMSDVVTSVPNANRKVNYIVSWDTKTNVYTSVTMREIFETDEGNLDTESVVDLVNRDGSWKVVNYTRTLNIKTSSVKTDAKNALSENSK